MCGIIAIVRGAQDRASSNVEELAATLEALPGQLRIDPAVWPEAISSSADALEGVNRELRGTAGVRGLLADPDATQRVDMACDRLDALVVAAEEYLDDPAHGLAADLLEPTNSALLRCKDALWAISRDRLRAADGIRKLTTQVPGAAGIAVLLSLQALSAIDRPGGVRRRQRRNRGATHRSWSRRARPCGGRGAGPRSDSTFTNASVRLVDGVLVIVHKAAAEIGELGDNTALRDSIRGDELLRAALSADDVQGVVIGHTRWASIGIVSEPNAHPQSSDGWAPPETVVDRWPQLC
ncbi:MAG: hypothetical protein R2789_16970 [Microthrixaceae bacterium]